MALYSDGLSFNCSIIHLVLLKYCFPYWDCSFHVGTQCDAAQGDGICCSSIFAQIDVKCIWEVQSDGGLHEKWKLEVCPGLAASS